MLQLSSLMSIFMSRIYRSKLGVVSLYIIIKSEHLAFDEGETYGGGVLVVCVTELLLTERLVPVFSHSCYSSNRFVLH